MIGHSKFAFQPPDFFMRSPAHKPKYRYLNHRWPLYGGVILAIWLSYGLYGDTLSFPFLQEDVSHIRWLEGFRHLDIFFTAAGAPDYRPLGKFIIKLWDIILGEHNRAWLRYHNLVFNALSIALTGRLISWIDRRQVRYATGGFSAILFAGFPFAYQAIPWINNFFYPLINLLLLLMTALYWQARQRHDRRLLLLALLLAVIAPFEIEYGAMGFTLLLTVEIVQWLQGQQKRIWLLGPVFGLLMNSLFVLIWFTIPKESYFFGYPEPERIFQIISYLLQGLMYPLAPVGQWLMNQFALSDIAAVWLVSLPALVVMIIGLLRSQSRDLVLVVLLWFGALNLPALVILDFDYVINSPRLLYPPGVAVCWLWGAVLTLPLGIKIRPSLVWLRPLLSSLFLLLILIPGLGFVERRLDYYRLIEQPVQQLTRAALAADPAQSLLIVNFPSWLTPSERHFPLGNHGIQLIPGYIGIGDFIYAHNGEDQPTRTVQFANVRETQTYYSGLHGPETSYETLKELLLTSGDVYLTHYGATEIDLQWAGRVTDLERLPLLVRFGDVLVLEQAQSHENGDTVVVQLQWRLTAPINEDLAIFVHLYQDGTLIAQADGYPLQGLAPFWLWSPEQALQDRRLLSPQEELPETYIIGVGVYNAASGERLPAMTTDGLLPNNTFIIPATSQP